MSTPPRTTKEALFAEMLGDMDSMITRIEKLPEVVESCEKRLRDAAAVLESAGEQYKLAVAAFTEQAKGELAGFLEKESVKIIEKQAESIRQIVLTDQLSKSGKPKSMPLKKLPLHLLTHGATAFLTSWITIIYFC